jgi:hypothetical protein
MMAEVRCPECGNHNSENTENCIHCNAVLSIADSEFTTNESLQRGSGDVVGDNPETEFITDRVDEPSNDWWMDPMLGLGSTTEARFPQESQEEKKVENQKGWLAKIIGKIATIGKPGSYEPEEETPEQLEEAVNLMASADISGDRFDSPGEEIKSSNTDGEDTSDRMSDGKEYFAGKAEADEQSEGISELIGLPAVGNGLDDKPGDASDDWDDLDGLKEWLENDSPASLEKGAAADLPEAPLISSSEESLLADADEVSGRKIKSELPGWMYDSKKLPPEEDPSALSDLELPQWLADVTPLPHAGDPVDELVNEVRSEESTAVSKPDTSNSVSTEDEAEMYSEPDISAKDLEPEDLDVTFDTIVAEEFHNDEVQSVAKSEFSQSIDGLEEKNIASQPETDDALSSAADIGEPVATDSGPAENEEQDVNDSGSGEVSEMGAADWLSSLIGDSSELKDENLVEKEAVAEKTFILQKGPEAGDETLENVDIPEVSVAPDEFVGLQGEVQMDPAEDLGGLEAPDDLSQDEYLEGREEKAPEVDVIPDLLQDERIDEVTPVIEQSASDEQEVYLLSATAASGESSSGTPSDDEDLPDEISRDDSLKRKYSSTPDGDGLSDSPFSDDSISLWASSTYDEEAAADLLGEDEAMEFVDPKKSDFQKEAVDIHGSLLGEDDRIDPTMEKDGPLAGLRDVLPSQDVFSQLQIPAVYSTKLEVSEKQRSQAALFESLLAEETQPHKLPAARRRDTSHSIRLAIGVLLVLLLAVPIMGNLNVLSLPGFIPPETQMFFNVVEKSLELDGEPILLAVEYEPGFSGELRVSSMPVIENLLSGNAHLTIVSTVPSGPFLAEDLLGRAALQNPDYMMSKSIFNLGYLAGNAYALQEFAQNPRSAARFGLDSQDAWNSHPALVGIENLEDYSLVIVLTDNATTARSWVEQVQPSLKDVPLLMVASSQAGPLIAPYVESGQVEGMISGLTGGLAYERLSGSSGAGHSYWDAFYIGLVLAAALILLGAIAQLLPSPSSRRRRRKKV